MAKTKTSKPKRPAVRVQRACSGATQDFYRGVEYFACWLLDNQEGETITEEVLREWATRAWRARKKRQNAGDERQPPRPVCPIGGQP